ncbi:MAG: hypothetical protein RXR06_06705, partial [Thermoproteus sp.]
MVDVSAITYDALRVAAEHVLAKVREGEELGTEDIFILYLGTIVNELRDVRSEVARLEDKIDKTSQRIDETNKRIDELAKSLSARIDD